MPQPLAHVPQGACKPRQELRVRTRRPAGQEPGLGRWAWRARRRRGSGPVRSLVRRSTGSIPPASPTEGAHVNLPTITATGVTDHGLAPGTYSYAVFTSDFAGNTSIAAAVTGTINP